MSRDRTVGDTFYILFTTRAFATGIPTVLSGTPVVSAYEDNSATQITAGITIGADHDSVAGLNLLTIVATGANGFETGKDYNLVITTGTVDSVSVIGEVVGQFSLGLSAAAIDLANGTDGLGAIKSDTAATLTDTAAMQPLVAKIPLSDGSISWNSTALASINAEADTALTDYDGPTRTEATSDKDEIITDLDDIKGTGFVKDTHSLFDIEGFVDILDDGTSGNAKIATDVATVLVDTADMQPKVAKIPLSDGSITWNATALASINTEADTALTDIHLDHLFAVDYDPASKPGTATAWANELVEDDGGVTRYTANALEQAPGGGGSGKIGNSPQSFTLAKGATSQIIQFSAYDSSDANGGKLTGLVFNTASLTAHYNRTGAAGSATAITLVTATKGTFTSSGFIVVDATNQPGEYELHVPDAAFATGVDRVSITLKGATNLKTVTINIDLVSEIDLGTDDRVLISADTHTSGESGIVTTIPALIATAQSDLDIITGASGVNLLTATQTSIDAIETDTAAMQPLVAKIPLSDGSITWNSTALGSINAECDTALTDYDGPTNTEMEARTLVAASYFDPTADAVANVTLVATTTTNTDLVSASDIATFQLTESYAADGTAPTFAQALFLTMQNVQEFAIVGTTITVKKLDGSTTAATYTLDDGTSPTSKTRTT